jgi:hypothetical protein
MSVAVRRFNDTLEIRTALIMRMLESGVMPHVWREMFV